MSITPLTSITSPRSLPQPEPASTKGIGTAVFGQVLEQLLASGARSSQQANQMVQSLVTGQADNLHSVSLAVQQADISFRLILEMRNRLTDAYQSIMNMQI